jgi:protein arginine kinase activator
MAKSFSSAVCACGRPADVFVSWVRSGQARTTAFCAPHAAAAGMLHPQGYALLEAETLGGRADGSPRCAVCDCSQRDFERQGRFGCPSCYTTFAGILRPMLLRMHRGLEHRGKIPLRDADPAVVRRRIERLQEELHDAVRAEHFEWAAQTRDAIAELQAKLPAPDAHEGRRGAALPLENRGHAPKPSPATEG